MDYAMKKGVSLSTLRRHIKSNKVEYKVEGGRYLLFVSENESEEEPGMLDRFSPQPVSPRMASQDSAPKHSLQTRIDQLEHELDHAREEIAELKMLIALYEEKIPPQKFDN